MSDYRIFHRALALEHGRSAPRVRPMNPRTPSAVAEISGDTQVFMVLGDPVRQVQAPAIFNRVFQRHGVDAVLVPVQVAPAGLEAFANAVLHGGNVGGLCLTIPHKTALVPRLGRIDAAGALAGSVNAVRRGPAGGLEGALFDGLGLLGALHHHGIGLANARVLLVGVGGAGAAIAAALSPEPLAALVLQDLGARAAVLAARLDRPHIRAAAADEDLSTFDLVIHATPLGLRPHDPLPLDVSRLAPHARVVDILMKRPETPLLRACAARGLRAHPGFEMLVQQVPAYLRFFGLDALALRVQDDLADVRRHLGTD